MSLRSIFSTFLFIYVSSVTLKYATAMRFLFIADLSITLGTGISKEMVG
jgi:hypothetical protein